ncbi:hypothetical protein VIK251_00051 [Klebsiella phage vB_KpnM_VIK251]|nr:hypothetical protein VIK251_00051 [Klebsiella phage vB_KpnM_VIK251]
MAFDTIKIMELPSATQVVEEDYLVVEQPDKTRKATVSQVISDLDLANKGDLAADGGASLIGTSDGTDVQQSLDTARANERELWRRALHDLGLTLVEGSFEDGATLTYGTDAIWHIAGAQCYTWAGLFPKNVPAQSLPQNTGGISSSAWVAVEGLSILDEVSEMRDETLIARDQAEAYALQASELGNIYPTVSAGIAATTNGQYFQVPQGSESSISFRAYLNNNGVAQEVASVPGAAAIRNTERLFSDLSSAQAEVSSGNILDGGFFWVRNSSNNILADEYRNISGVVSKTGRQTITTGYVDSEIKKVVDAGASVPYNTFSDVGWAWIDGEGKSLFEILSDGTVNVPALLVGKSIEISSLEAGTVTIKNRDDGNDILSISPSGQVSFGTTTTWFTDEEFFDGYAAAWMDSEGKVYKVQHYDGTIEDATSEGGGGSATDTSKFPAVASVNGNIIAVNNETLSQVTTDSSVENIGPVAYETFVRYLSNISGSFLAYRSSYDGKFRVREQNKKLVHVIVTGQSLAAGGSTKTQSPVTTVSPVDYGVLSFATGPKVDFKYDTLDESLLNTVIPCREDLGTRPNQESPSSGVAYKVREITGSSVLVTDACSSGTAIADISLGTATFTGATKMIQAAAKLAKSLNLEYSPVLVFIHGNQNAAAGTSIASYRSSMEALRVQYQNVVNDAAELTSPLHMFVGQLSNTIPYGGSAGSTRTNNIGIAQYEESRDNEFIHLASAQYARPYSDGEHLTSEGYRTEGEVIGTMVGQWLNNPEKTSLIPDEENVVQTGNTITIPILGAVGNLTIDTNRVTDPGNFGFILTGASISSVSISGNNVVITKTDTATATRVAYASTGIAGQNPGPVTGSRGCIRDSQAGVSLSGLPLYNDLCVFAFNI